MYLLDTNVVSELRKAKTGKVNRNVRAWAKSVSASTLYLSVISILELEIGILLVERRDHSQGGVLACPHSSF
jgi:predicted nucleic acid-binding protein